VRSLSLVLVLLIAGCSSPTNTLPDPDPLTGGVDVHMRMEGSDLRWSLATQEVQPCSNLGIQTRTILFADPWILYVDGIQYASLCDNALGPARAEWSFGSMPAGDQRFRVVLAQGTGEGTIHVTADSIVVDYDGPGLHFVETAIARN